MFIQTETTPNPQTLKFIPGKTVLERGTLDIRDARAAERSPLAKRLFAISGVTGVFYGYDFVSVTKEDGEWQHLKPAILGAIMEHFMSGDPLIADDKLQANVASGADDADEFFDEADKATVNTIKELLETRVRPAVAQDGGDIVFREFRDGVVYLHMQGSCSGCPSSTATLKMGIENLLKHYVPEVVEVQAAL